MCPEARTSYLHVVACINEIVVHVLVVRVWMVAMPVEDIVPDVKVVSGEISWRVPDAVELVPEHALLTLGRWDDARCGSIGH